MNNSWSNFYHFKQEPKESELESQNKLIISWIRKRKFYQLSLKMFWRDKIQKIWNKRKKAEIKHEFCKILIYFNKVVGKVLQLSKTKMSGVIWKRINKIEKDDQVVNLIVCFKRKEENLIVCYNRKQKKSRNISHLSTSKSDYTHQTNHSDKSKVKVIVFQH